MSLVSHNKNLFLCEDEKLWKDLLVDDGDLAIFCFDQFQMIESKKFACIIVAGSEDQLYSWYPCIKEKYPNTPILGVCNGGLKQSRLQGYMDLGYEYCMTASQIEFREELHKAIFISKKMFASRKMSQEETRFLAQIIHDIKLPVSTIKHSLLSINEEDQVELSKELRRIEQASKFIEELLIRGLETSKKSDHEKRVFDIKLHISEIIDLVSKQMAAKELQLKIHDESIALKNMQGDIGKIKQIILNLLGNAMKFTPPGGQIDLWFKTEEKRQAAFLYILVEDSGIGIPEEKQSQIFDDYMQAHGQLSAREGGQGLGLGIVKTIIKEIGGTIRVTSCPGKGSKFAVTIPLDIPHKAMIAQSKADVGLGLAEKRLKILVVDDAKDCKLLIRAYLKAFEPTIMECENGYEALGLFKRHNFDIVLMDISMPIMDGFEAIAAMRYWESINSLPRTPIIALTGLNRKTDIDRCRESGFDAFVPKPVEGQPLIMKINSFIEEKNKVHLYKHSSSITWKV